MPELAAAYVPIDRRATLAGGSAIRPIVRGTAVEADLAGFTSLTEALAGALGEQRGAEELTRRLNRIYDGLIEAVHRYRGSVLGFSGDALTCWFDGDGGERAVTCAIELQEWAQRCASEALEAGTTSLQMKVALATGSARRYLVGDPDIQLLEGLAGRLMDELAASEHGARAGEIVLAASTATSLGSAVHTEERGVLIGAERLTEASPWPPIADQAAEALRPWLLPEVYERLAAGHGQFIAELRPVTALFLRFSGIDYETDPAALERLDRWIRASQKIIRDHGGTLLQLTIGDKGSYFYAAFGAPIAHEDDPARALRAAVALRELSQEGTLVEPVSIGVSTGRLRAGAYGGTDRRTYGVLGDAVNLAARLMQAAGPGQIVVTDAVRTSTGDGFSWSGSSELTVKGKALPVLTSQLVGASTHSSRRQRRSDATLGRDREVAVLDAQLRLAAEGSGRVVALIAEAGVGKTHLAGKLVARARATGIKTVEAECPSFASAAYHPWRSLLPELFGLDRDDDRVAAAASALAEVNPSMVASLEIVAPALGIETADTELAASLDPKVRKAALEATVTDWVRSVVVEPTVVLIEDCHWIDPLSEDLLCSIARASRSVPLLILLTQRERDLSEGGLLSVGELDNFVAIDLAPLSVDATESLIRSRLGPRASSSGFADSIKALAERAGGNPFYAGELVDHLMDLARDGEPDATQVSELPSSLQSLVLARVDRLAERPRATIKVASSFGRVFPVSTLAEVSPALGSLGEVASSVNVLEEGRFVSDLGDGREEFVHAIIQEVTYSTIVEETRTALHGAVGRTLERRMAGEPDLEVLAYHFGRSDDREGSKKWVLRAAEAARSRYANQAAIAHYETVLPLLEGAERAEALLTLGKTLALTGRWETADDVFSTAVEEAAHSGDRGRVGRARIEQAELLRKQGDYENAAGVFDEAGEHLDSAGDRLGLAELQHLRGTLAAQQGNLSEAGDRFQAALDIWRQAGDRRNQARSLNGLGIVAEYQNRMSDASALYEQALSILSESGDRWGEAALINNLGMIELLSGDPHRARPRFERAVALQREIGDPHMLANFLSNLGDSARDLSDVEAARVCYSEALSLAFRLGERWLLAFLLEDVALLAAAAATAAEDEEEAGASTSSGRMAARRALVLAAGAGRLREETGSPLPEANREKLDEAVTASKRRLGGEGAAAWSEGSDLDLVGAVELAQVTLNALRRSDGKPGV